MRIEFGSRPSAELRWPPENIGFKVHMHFGFYLMIAALVVMGLEVAYALYQLASFVL
jgi:hypothetical protein